MRRSILLLFSFGVIVAGASAGDLHTDIFGNVYDGDWSIPVGQVEARQRRTPEGRCVRQYLR